MKRKLVIYSYYSTGYKRIKNEFLDSDFPKKGCNHWGISIVISLESFVETSLSLTTRFTTSTISIGTIFTRQIFHTSLKNIASTSKYIVSSVLLSMVIFIRKNFLRDI
ncbi:unnamed protein product [Rhizophagus irregularis]|nr:unnamed protein product [Rhizophagus irregularis]